MSASATSNSSDRGRSMSPPRSIPTDGEIEQVIQMATSNARAGGSGVRSPMGRDTRTQLFVGNLPYRVRWQDLKDLFRKAGGTVLRADVSLGPDNRSRGYGTVLLASAEDAGRAIDMFNGYVWQTRTLEVRPDRLPSDYDGPIGVIKPPTTTQPLSFNSTYQASSPLHNMSMMSSALGSSPTSTLLSSSLSYSTGLRESDYHDSTSPLSRNATPMTGSLPSPLQLGSLGSSLVPSPLETPSRNPDLTALYRDVLKVDPTSMGGLATRTVRVENIPAHIPEGEVRETFSQVGPIINIDLGSRVDATRKFDTIVYDTPAQAEAASKFFDGMELYGAKLRTEQVGSLMLQRPEEQDVLYRTGTTEEKAEPSPRSASRPGKLVMPTASTPYSIPTMPSPTGSPYDSYPPHLLYGLTPNVPGSPQAMYPPHYPMYSYGAAPWPPSPTTASGSGNPASQSSVPTAASPTRASGAHPGPISLPAPGPPQAGYPGSPSYPPALHGLPPMTPSMPSFTFMPQPVITPPLHPHFLSPGVGPYSPIGSSPGFFGAAVNPYFNLTPGAPVGGAATGGGGGATENSPYFDLTAATAGSDAADYFPFVPPPPQSGEEGQPRSDSTEVVPLEPVGVDKDGFPSLSAKHDTTTSASPDQLPESLHAPRLEGPSLSQPEKKSTETPAITERSLSADDAGSSNGSNSGGNRNTTATAAGPIYSSTNKPKLTLGSLSARSPPANQGTSSAQDTSFGPDSYKVGQTNSGSGPGPLKVNGTPNGFRDSLRVEPEEGGIRRASWTEDASMRQSIVTGLMKPATGAKLS